MSKETGAVAPTLVRDWDFKPSRAPLWYERERLTSALRLRHAPPKSEMLKPVSASPRWSLYFVYLPDGVLGEPHQFTLDQLRKLDRKLMVVCAAPTSADIPPALIEAADAIYWKGLDGFDFSAYAIGLSAIAAGSPGAQVLVLNDSVFGPFGDIAPLIERARWDLTGFTASLQFESHIQSYAFLIRDLTAVRLRALRSIFPVSFAYNELWPVVACFETRLARVASRRMTVGAFWLGPDDGSDPTVSHALELLDQGFPFVKKSLVGKHRSKQDEAKVRDALAQRGHPAPAPAPDPEQGRG